MLRRLSERDYYEVLEVPYDATPEEIRSAYEEAREMYTHDALVSGSILSDQERRRTYEFIADAYQTLIAEDSRRIYDETIGIRANRAARAAGQVERSAGAGAEPALAPALAALEPGSELEAAAEPEPEPLPATRNLTVAQQRPGPRRCTLQLGIAEEATGDFLRCARESMGLDLGTISEETKIGRSMLEYIEGERLDRLPAQVYLRNFTLQFARCLGLDGERVSRTYLARIRRLQSRVDA